MDSILNLTVEDFLDRTPKGDGFILTVKYHKTDKKDFVHIYIDRSLYNMINTFYHGIRKEQPFKPTFYGQYMFCTVDGDRLKRLDDAIGILNKFIIDNGELLLPKNKIIKVWRSLIIDIFHISDLGNVRITPNDTRFLFSNWGEGHSIEEIRMSVAAAQNHSQATHDKHYNYLRAAQKTKLTLTYLQERGGGEAGDLDVPENPEYEQQTLQQIEEQRKKHIVGKNFLWRSIDCVTSDL